MSGSGFVVRGRVMLSFPKIFGLSCTKHITYMVGGCVNWAGSSECPPSLDNAPWAACFADFGGDFTASAEDRVLALEDDIGRRAVGRTCNHRGKKAFIAHKKKVKDLLRADEKDTWFMDHCEFE